MRAQKERGKEQLQQQQEDETQPATDLQLDAAKARLLSRHVARHAVAAAGVRRLV